MTVVPSFNAKLSGLFKGMGKVKSSQDANYMKPGNYLVRIDRFKADKGRTGALVAIEMTCLAHVGPVAPGTEPHAPLESMTHLIPNFGKGVDMFLPNVKAFIENIIGVPPEEMSDDDKMEEYALTLASDAQPLRGVVAHVEARQITTRAGTPFTKVSWQREVPAAEALKLLPPEILTVAYPDNALQRRAVFEAGMAEGLTPDQAKAKADAAVPPTIAPPKA